MLGRDSFEEQLGFSFFDMKLDASTCVAYDDLITRGRRDCALFKSRQILFGDDGIDNCMDVSSRSVFMFVGKVPRS